MGKPLGIRRGWNERCRGKRIRSKLHSDLDDHHRGLKNVEPLTSSGRNWGN